MGGPVLPHIGPMKRHLFATVALFAAIGSSSAGEQTGALQPGMEPEAFVALIDALETPPVAAPAKARGRYPGASTEDAPLSEPMFLSIAGVFLAIGIGGFIASALATPKIRRR